MALQKITPFLWFDNQAAEAALFYSTVFPNSRIISTNPMVTSFELEGLQISAINGGPMFKLTEAFSFYISCETQAEIDYYWNKLSEGGEESMCGWLKDKYGLSWQVIPTVLVQLMNNAEKAPKAMKAFLKMKKFNIEELLNATI